MKTEPTSPEESMSEEKRSFSRVEARVKTYARRVDSLESPQLFRGCAIGEFSSREGFAATSKLPDDLANFLMEMDRKMDRILGLLSQDQLRDDFPLNLDVMEISAAGVRFRTDDPLKVDDCLEAVFVLNRVPLKMAGAKGRIVGLDAETNLFRFEFVNIRDTDKEAIVQFVFQQQREQIRNSSMR